MKYLSRLFNQFLVRQAFQLHSIFVSKNCLLLIIQNKIIKTLEWKEHFNQPSPLFISRQIYTHISNIVFCSEFRLWSYREYPSNFFFKKRAIFIDLLNDEEKPHHLPFISTRGSYLLLSIRSILNCTNCTNYLCLINFQF